MAVIIPMAKMPNNCEECDLKGLCPDYWTKIREEYTRPSWCQLDDLDATTFCGIPMEEAAGIIQMYRRGELVHFKNYEISTNRKTEPQTCSNCKFDHEEWFEEACDSCCDAHSNWQPKTEPQTMVYPQVDGITPSVIVKDEPQTDCSWK